MFLNTLAIAEGVVRTASDKSKNGYTEKDKKRKTGNRTYPEAILKWVKQYQQISSDGISLCARKKQTSIFSI